jgi:hypothetical protein
MKIIVFALVLVMLVLATSCDLLCPEDEPSGWIEPDSLDFPVYVGHFGDYVHTDTNGNSLGTVVYGEDGDGKDWQILTYDPSDRGALPNLAGVEKGAKDEYHILIQAFDLCDESWELPAAIYFNGHDTGFATPHTFSFQGEYNPAWEDSFIVYLYPYEFPLEPEVSYDPGSNTYSYVFRGVEILVPPPWISFTATPDEQGHVLLRWVFESETNMLGYRLHRSETTDLAAAQVINPELIPDTNIGVAHTYSYTDVNVSAGQCYYYWLESVWEGGSSEFYGPCSVQIPPLPAENSIAAAYPNPCQNYFRVPVDVKLEGGATVLLLDSQGTVRQKDALGAGSHHHYMDVHGYDPGLYRVFIWFNDGNYAYGDVLIE